MSPEDGLALHVFEAELAHVEAAEASILLRVRRVVPRVELVTTEHDGFDHVAALRHLTLETQFLLERDE